MTENIKIDERDKFNFVFFDDLLSEEKMRYLENNENKIEMIGFYKKLKENIAETLSKELREKIAANIPAYKIQNIIKLFPVNDKIEKRPSEVPVLAAASAPEEAKVSAQTFIDESKTFLIRLLRTDDKTKIFTFPITHTDIESVQITLHPEENTFTVHNNEPFELEGKHNVEAISIELG